MLYTYTQDTAQTKTNQHKCQPDPNTNKTAFCPNIIRDCVQIELFPIRPGQWRTVISAQYDHKIFLNRTRI